jgi:hypothetical protein
MGVGLGLKLGELRGPTEFGGALPYDNQCFEMSRGKKS